MVKNTMWALVALMILLTGPALASGHNGVQRQLEEISGQTVPTLGMNQLRAYRAIQPQVLAAAGQYRNDAVVDRLITFIDRQDAAMTAFGAIWYGAWQDERHPQHPPIHGVLAGTAALLGRLEAIAPQDAAVMKLAAAKGLNPALQELCTSAVPVDLSVIRTWTWQDMSAYYGHRYAKPLRLAGVLLLVLVFWLFARRLPVRQQDPRTA